MTGELVKHVKRARALQGSLHKTMVMSVHANSCSHLVVQCARYSQHGEKKKKKGSIVDRRVAFVGLQHA